MAYVKLTNGKSKKLSAEQGVAIWRCLEGQDEPTKEQTAFCEQVQDIFLDPYTAPVDYIQKKGDLVFRYVLKDYMCGPNGRLTIPSPARPYAVDFVNKWSWDMTRAKQQWPKG